MKVGGIMGNYIWYRSGEIVRDIGMIYFYELLEAYQQQQQQEINIEMNANHLRISGEVDTEAFNQFFHDYVMFEMFKIDLVVALKNKKIQDDVLVAVQLQTTYEDLKTYCLQADVQVRKVYEAESKKDQYLPYLRNSGKFGANSGGVGNFKKNLKELIRLVFSANQCLDNQEAHWQEVYEHYQIADENAEITSFCSVCHYEPVSMYDITHKYKQEIVETLKPNTRIVRKTSKYLYSFLGSEGNTYKNYGQVQSDVCFTCEFFNLLFLCFVKISKPSSVILADTLKETKLLNYRYGIKSTEYTKESFLLKIIEQSRGRVRVFSIETDANKGVILRLQNVVESKKIIQQLRMTALVDNYHFTVATSEQRKFLKDAIFNGNQHGVKQTLLANIIQQKEVELTQNLQTYRSYIICLLEERDVEKTPKHGYYYRKLGQEIHAKNSNQQTTAYKLIQLLKAENRTELATLMMHVVVGTGKALPYNFANDVLNSTELELHYYISEFITGLLGTKGGTDYETN